MDLVARKPTCSLRFSCSQSIIGGCISCGIKGRFWGVATSLDLKSEERIKHQLAVGAKWAQHSRAPAYTVSLAEPLKKVIV